MSVMRSEMVVNFSISGSTASEIERNAQKRLSDFDGEDDDTARWNVRYYVTSQLMTGDGSTLLWTADVTAERVARSQARDV